jgi:hypothetical protein
MIEGGDLKPKRGRKSGKSILGNIGSVLDATTGFGLNPNESLQHKNANVKSINDSSTPTNIITKHKKGKGTGTLLEVPTVQHSGGHLLLADKRTKAIKGKKNGLLHNPHSQVLHSRSGVHKTSGGSFMELQTVPMVGGSFKSV